MNIISLFCCQSTSGHILHFCPGLLLFHLCSLFAAGVLAPFVYLKKQLTAKPAQNQRRLRGFLGTKITQVCLCCFFLGVLRWQAEGEREHHAESEAAGHPEGLRQAVSSSANQSDDSMN